MRAKITKVSFQKEYEGDFGTLYLFKVYYNNTYGLYTSKSKDQKNFIAGEEAEFTEETVKKGSKEWTKIKPFRPSQYNNFTRAVKKEQSRYSGFAVSYAKDLVIADKISLDDMHSFAEGLFNLMVELDKTLE